MVVTEGKTVDSQGLDEQHIPNVVEMLSEYIDPEKLKEAYDLFKQEQEQKGEEFFKDMTMAEKLELYGLQPEDIDNLDFKSYDLEDPAQLNKWLHIVLFKIFVMGISAKEVLSVPEEFEENLYCAAYTYYNGGKYDEAQQLFSLLSFIDPKSFRYNFGLASSLHRLEDYENAANAYFKAGLRNPHNPLPHMYAADCYSRLGDRQSAMDSLFLCIDCCGEDQHWASTKNRAEIIYNSIEKLIKE